MELDSVGANSQAVTGARQVLFELEICCDRRSTQVVRCHIRGASRDGCRRDHTRSSKTPESSIATALHRTLLGRIPE
jgi:hypothetical protein